MAESGCSLYFCENVDMFGELSSTTTGVDSRVYRAAGFWKVAMTVCALLLICGSATGAYLDLHRQTGPWQANVLLLLLCFFFFTLGFYCLLWVFKARLVLAPNQLVIEGPFVTKVLTCEQLLGWRMMPTSPPTLVLKDRELHSTRVNLLFQPDDEFVEWLSRLPALDVEEAFASEAEILDDERLGNTVSDRTASLQEGLRRTRLLNGFSVLVSLWAIIYPRPYFPLMLLLVALPWLATEVSRQSHGLIRMDEVRNDAHPNLALMYLFPILALCLRAVFDYEILYSGLLLLWCLAISAALIAVLLMVDPSTRTRKTIITALYAFALIYAYGATVEVNGMQERSPVTYVTTVQGKHVNHGKRTSYDIRLGPWGPKTSENELEVSEATYNSLQPGNHASVKLRTGWLGVQSCYLTVDP